MRRLILALSLVLVACATPRVLKPMDIESPPMPSFNVPDETFVSFDGAELGLTVWEGQGEPKPKHVILGVHGMNDYANAFHLAAPWFAERGVTTYAYDQRGFGRSAGRGIWPDETLLQQDMRTAIKIARERHPDATITLVGISMGGSVAMTLFGSDDPPLGVDRLVLSGPGLRGWGALNWLYRGALWLSTHTRPGWVVVPPRGVKIEPTDNLDVQRQYSRDPLTLSDNRIDQVYGVVDLMENAHLATKKLSSQTPTMLTYGAKDIVVPKAAVKRTMRILPKHVRTAYYPKGYHMLLRDLQAETVYADMWAFMQDPASPFPSGVDPVPRR